MKKIKKIFSPAYHLVILFLALLLVSLFFLKSSWAGEAHVIYLDEKTVAQVNITPRGTALSFPVKPENVVLGQNGSFGLEYINSDVIISPLRSNSHANLFVYLMGRRYTFDLISSESRGYTIIIVKDKRENQMRFDIHGK